MREANSVDNFQTTRILMWLLFYKICIEIVYVFLIHPTYNYMGMDLNIDFGKFVVSNILAILIFVSSPRDKDRPSTYFFLILEFFIIIPILSYFWLNDMSILYTLYLSTSALVVALVLKMKVRNFTIKNRASKIIIDAFFVLYVLVTILIVISRGGIDLRTLNFDLVYDLRSENTISGFAGYLVNWSVKVFSPFYIAYFYLRKNIKGVVFVSFLQLLMYLSFGNKAFLFSIGIIAINLLYVQRGKYLREMTLTMSGLNLLALLLSSLKITDIVQRTVPYRLLFIPAQIQYFYYDFFLNSGKLMFSDSIIGRILSIRNPYGVSISHYLGEFHYGIGVNANTGLFADAYANGGFIMMLLFSFIFASLLLLIDASTVRVPTHIVVGALSYIMFVINDAPFLTMLNTGGMFIMIFMLVFLNSTIKVKTLSL